MTISEFFDYLDAAFSEVCNAVLDLPVWVLWVAFCVAFALHFDILDFSLDVRDVLNPCHRRAKPKE